MPEPAVIPPAGGELVGDAPDRRVEILADADALHATWSRFGPRRDGAELHVHRRHTDLFYVLDGELTIRLGGEGEPVAMPAGALARIPPLVVHGFRNAGDADVRYLNFHAPGSGFAGYLRALRDGHAPAYDQEPPPSEGARPAAAAAISGGELVADGPGGRVVLLADADEIAIAEIRADAGASTPHVHRRHVECLYVLEGELALAIGGRELRAGAGSWVEVPAGVAHRVSVAGAAPARLLDVHAPGCGFGAFARALGDLGGDERRAAARAGFDQAPAP